MNKKGLVTLILMLAMVIMGIFVGYKSSIEKSETLLEGNTTTPYSLETLNNVDVVNETVSENEENEIQEYINTICNSVIKITEFDNINNADKKWIYSHLFTYNKENDSFTEEKIVEMLENIFGSELQINVPEDTKDADGYYIPASNGNGKYEFLPFGDEITVDYMINEIKKENNYYVVSLIEYSIQYDMDTDNPEENLAVFKYNKTSDNDYENWEKVFNIDNEETDNEITNKILENKDDFVIYNLTLQKNDNNKFYVVKFEKQ